jgi:hypothetical protein
MSRFQNPYHDQILAALAEGKTYSQIAERYGVTRNIVSGIAHRAKLAAGTATKGVKLDQWAADDVKVLKKLVKWSWPVASIAQALGISASAVRAKMFRDGIEYRAPAAPREIGV